MLTITATALLDDLHDSANEAVWQELDSRYRPILVGFARKLGLGTEDAADVAQEALSRFVRAYRDGKYVRGRGRLRSWIIGIAKNCIIDLQRTHAVRREQRGMSAVIDLADQNRLTAIWEDECEQEILKKALNTLRTESRFEERTVTAFELMAFRQLNASEVAADLDMSLNDVYLAKNRCLKRLRAIIRDMTVGYEMDH